MIHAVMYDQLRIFFFFFYSLQITPCEEKAFRAFITIPSVHLVSEVHPKILRYLHYHHLQKNNTRFVDCSRL